MRLTAPLLLVATLAAPARADDPPKIDLKKGITFAGRAEADVVQVRPRVAGYLSRVLVKDGDAVKKGDLLAEIDDRPYLAKVKGAKAELAVAQAKAKLAAANLARVNQAFTNGAATKEDVTKAELEQDVAKAETMVAEAVLATTEIELAYTKLRAAIDGRVGRVLLTEGNLVLRDGEAVTTVVSDNPIAVTFEVDEKTLLALIDALATGGKPAAEVGRGNEDGYPHKAAIEAKSFAVDPKTGTARFRATLANPKGLIVDGLYLRVRLTVQPK